MVRAAVIAFLIAVLPIQAKAEGRVALLIGNGAYARVSALPNPPRDAAAMAALLRKSGFDVVEKTNLGADAMRRALRDFSDRARNADVAVVFYAGHGMEVNGINYLIPVDAVLERDIDVEDETVSLNRVNQVLEGTRRLKLVILDACRDNPFVRSMKRTLAGRSIGRGLAQIDVVSPDTLIAYAAKAGSTAADGDKANSPYTVALVSHLTTPGLDVRLALGRVRDEVLRSTGNRQEPFVYGSLGGAELPLVPAAANSQPPTQAQLSEAAEAWGATKDTMNIAILEAFIVRYKDTFFAELARARIDELKKQQAGAAEPSWWERLTAGTSTAPAPKHYTPEHMAIATPHPPPPSAQKSKPAAVIAPMRCDGIEIAVGQNERRCFKPGAGKTEHFKDCPACPEMVVVPAGNFVMGSRASEPRRLSSEEQVRASIGATFAVGRFAVTFDEWDACVADGGCNRYKPADQGWGRGKRPVINISWNDAKSYASWLSHKTGKTYRLLSETEREYVTRAGTDTPFWWGSSITPDQANYDGNFTYSGGSKGESRKRTVPVDSFEPNSWGLYNVHGNVWEWTEDCWNDSNRGNPGDGRARTTGNCSQRVVRGGSWKTYPNYIRSAGRSGDFTNTRDGLQGFRLARTLAP